MLLWTVFLLLQVLCSRLCPGVNELNNNGETPLNVACRMGRVENVKALLAGGAKCDVVGSSGFPIHSAMKYNQKEWVREKMISVDQKQCFRKIVMLSSLFFVCLSAVWRRSSKQIQTSYTPRILCTEGRPFTGPKLLRWGVHRRSLWLFAYE